MPAKHQQKRDGDAGNIEQFADNAPQNEMNDAPATHAGQPQQQSTAAPEVTDAANKVAEKVGDLLGGDTGAAKDLYTEAKKGAGAVANQAYSQAQEKASTTFTEGKSTVAQGLGAVADNVRQLGENLRGGEAKGAIVDLTAKYGDQLASQVENISRFIDEKDFGQLAGELKGFAKRNPTLFLGGAFVAGLLLARFLKAAPRPTRAMVRTQDGDTNFATTGMTPTGDSGDAPAIY